MFHSNFSSTSFTTNQFQLMTHQTRTENGTQDIMSILAQLSLCPQWILITSECPRPKYDYFASFNIHCDKVIQMKASSSQTEYDIVRKAIKTGNASAIIASNRIALPEQHQLTTLAQQYHCEVFFITDPTHKFH